MSIRRRGFEHIACPAYCDRARKRRANFMGVYGLSLCTLCGFLPSVTMIDALEGVLLTSLYSDYHSAAIVISAVYRCCVLYSRSSVNILS